MLNNTVLQLGGLAGGKSMVGMLRDFVVFRNIALTRDEINEVMMQSAGRRDQEDGADGGRDQALEQLLRFYGLAEGVKMCTY